MLKLKVATVEMILCNKEVNAVTIKTIDGVITVLENHAPLVSLINDGYYKVDDEITNIKEALLIINDDSTVNIMISEI